MDYDYETNGIVIVVAEVLVLSLVLLLAFSGRIVDQCGSQAAALGACVLLALRADLR